MTETALDELDRGASPSIAPSVDRADGAAVDLVIFACEGREHLLRRTVASLDAACPFTFRRRIVAADGDVSADALAGVRPDVVVRNWSRSGYVASIYNALSQVRSPFFFWVEEDWQFTQPVDVERARSLLGAHADWVQIRLSKTAPLTDEERRLPLCPDLFGSTVGFSANPSLNRTEEIRAAMHAFASATASDPANFEEFLRAWFARHALTCAVLDPGSSPAVEHDGYLESTPRQWHMRSVEHPSAMPHVSGIGPSPALWRRLLVALRLMARATSVAVSQLRSDAAYETAFRFITMPRPKRGRPTP